MPDSLPHVDIPEKTWVDLYSETGIPVGSAVTIQIYSGSDEVNLVVAASQPANTDNAIYIKNDQGIYSVASGQSGLWAYADDNAALSVQYPSVTDSPAPSSASGGGGTPGSSVDAFGRLRVSNTGQRLDVEFLYNKQEEYFDEITSGGTVTWNSSSRDLTLSLLSATNGHFAEMRSHPVPYTPGNSQLIDMTGVLDGAALGGGTAEVFLRSTVTGSTIEQTIEQSSWEALTTGVDWSKSHIFMMDFQSLKVGSIRFSLVQNGTPTKVAQINNDNVRATGYWQLASLPVSYRIYNTATETIAEVAYGDGDNAIGFRYRVPVNASAQMRAICCTVKSEGGDGLFDIGGLARAADRGVTVKTVSTTLVPILSIRPKSTFNGVSNMNVVIPTAFSVQAGNPIRFAVLHDCSLTGASWSDVDTNESCVEFDVSATSFTNGHVVFSDYLWADTTGGFFGASDTRAFTGLLGKTVLWDRKGTETGIVTIAAVRTDTSNADVLASMQWRELR